MPLIPHVLAHMLCRLCHGSLQSLLDLGVLALPTFPQPGDPQVPRAPLDLRVCTACGLVQLAHTVPPDQLYQQYWYRSSINETMQTELRSVVRAALRETNIYPHDLVLDVGANDGYLLSCYPTERAHWEATRIAFEPAANLYAEVRKQCDVLIQGYFPPTVADFAGMQHRIKILTTIAMFYDLEDPGAAVTAIDQLLHPEGIWIVQFQDLAQMVQATAFDNICHEHLTYWSLATIEALLVRAGVDLHVTHAEPRAINGGSLRLHLRRRAHAADGSVDVIREAEQPHISWQALETFAWRVGEVRTQIQAALAEYQGQIVDLYGASTKANTLLQDRGLDGHVIRRAWERNPEKFGRTTATGIPIVDEGLARAEPPDLLLAGIWQFRDAILQREAAYLEAGGAILFPLPEVDLVRASRGHE